MGTISDKLTYLNTTKSQLKDQINYGLPSEKQITSSTTFREYVGSIFEAFLEALRNPDTLFTNLPKTSGSGSNITLNGTANAPMRINLNPTAISQDGTPTPDTPQDIHTISGSNSVVVRGANLFNKDTITTNTGWLIEDGTISQNHPDYYVSDYILVSPNTNYYRTKTGSTRAKYYDKNKQPLNTTSYQDISILGNAGTFTTPANCYYIRMTMKTENIDTLMLNLGTTATTYTPYVSQTAQLNLGDIEYCKIGDYEDKIFKNIPAFSEYDSNLIDGAWYIKKNIGKYVANNDLTGNGETDNLIQLLTPQLNITASLNTATLVSMSKSNMLSAYDSITYTGLAGTTTSSKIRINLSKDYASTEEQAKEVLSNLIIYYALATPTYTQITGTLETQLEQVYKNMLSQEGQTNISQVNNDLPFVINVSAITK